jgi:trafficking protein particle complex subunit 9
VDLVKFKSVSFPNISVAPPLPLLVANVVGGEGSILLYEGEIRDVLITLTNAGTVPVEEANIVLSERIRILLFQLLIAHGNLHFL